MAQLYQNVEDNQNEPTAIVIQDKLEGVSSNIKLKNSYINI